MSPPPHIYASTVSRRGRRWNRRRALRPVAFLGAVALLVVAGAALLVGLI